MLPELVPFGGAEEPDWLFPFVEVSVAAARIVVVACFAKSSMKTSGDAFASALSACVWMWSCLLFPGTV